MHLILKCIKRIGYLGVICKSVRLPDTCGCFRLEAIAVFASPSNLDSSRGLFQKIVQLSRVFFRDSAHFLLAFLL